MAYQSSPSRGEPGTHWIPDEHGVSASTRTVPRASLGHVVRSATAVVGLLTLAAWWDLDSSSGTENIIGTQPDRILSIALAADDRWLASGGYHGTVVIRDPARKRIESVLAG